MNLEQIKKNWKVFAESPNGKNILKGLKWSMTIGVLAFLFYQLNEIGWYSILTSLPTNPLFYLLFLSWYFALPVSEQFIYRLSIDFTFWEGFKVFMIKKILNSDIIAYSGEAYLFAYGNQNWSLDNKKLFHVVKDNNIISAFTSTLTAVVLLVVLVYFGQINFLDFITMSTTTLSVIVGLVVLVLGLAFYYRKKVIAFDTPTTLKIFSIHQVRLIFVYGVEVLYCIAALPSIPVNIWFTFLAIRIIFTRIPFLPSQDILLLGVYATVTELYDIPQAEIIAVYLMITALVRLLNLLFYGVFSLKGNVKA